MTKEHKEAWDESKLKTLKDMVDQIVIFGNPIKCLFFDEVKEQAIKWVKEEIEFGLFKGVTTLETKRWMKRLDITEDDLK